VKQRIGVVRCRQLLGAIGFGKEVGANGDVGARVEESLWIEVKSGGIVTLPSDCVSLNRPVFED
jgi:hypothetical protein